MIKNRVLDSECIFEKKKWISLTGLCNNNCVFCLDADRADKFHRSSEEIKIQIEKGRSEGATRLVLSGGEPTIHPNILNFIRYGKQAGYKKIQIITNGRMLAYRKFVDSVIEAGLDEVTFSIHGHTQKLHESLTGVQGSFAQIVMGIRNALSGGLIVNTDTVITKVNYRCLPEIISFIHSLGVNEVNLMSIVPFGRAWKNKDLVLFDFEDVAPYVHAAIEYCRSNGITIWLSRFPAKHLEGYESYIESYKKLAEDVLARGEDFFKEEPTCRGDRCKYCGISDVCNDIIVGIKVNRIRNNENTILVNKENVKKLPELIKKNTTKDKILKFDAGLGNDTIKMSEAAKYIKESISDIEKYSISGIPPCLLFPKKIRMADEYIVYKKGYDFSRFADEVCMNSRVKRKSCSSCILDNKCKGINREYVRMFGFDEFIPIMNKEIRINMDCNQNCLFCNTDNNAENVILERDKVLDNIYNYSKSGINYIVISGKEPTLSENLLDYIRFSKAKGFIKIEMQTNAIICSDKNYTRKLRVAGLTHAFVSLHAADEELSSKITRAPGTFASTLKGIKNLKEEGIAITINVVVNSLNYTHLKDITEFIHKNIEPESIVFSIVAPIVSAWKNKDIIPRLTEILPDLFEAIEYCKKNNIDFHIPSRCGVPICMVEKYRDNHDGFADPRRFSDSSDKIKNKSCKSCIYNESCTGLWKNYSKLYGTKELIPKRM